MTTEGRRNKRTASARFHPMQASYPRMKLLRLAAVLLLFAGCGVPAVRQGTAYFSLLRRDMPEILPVPVDGVPVQRLADSWGDARDGGRRAHEGIDIFAPRHTPVRSTTEGVVELKGTRGLGGRVVHITGPGGYRHYYAHLEDWGPQETGDWVVQGEVIGYVGNSGNAAGGPTHLHYGIYAPTGQAINPYPLLRPPAPVAAGP